MTYDMTFDPIAELRAGYDSFALGQTMTPWLLDWDAIVASLDGNDTRMYRQACALAELWRDRHDLG